jgi:hypothetical protein
VTEPKSIEDYDIEIAPLDGLKPSPENGIDGE